MKTATALTVAAIGAILAFAVTAEPSFFNFHAAGWVLMLTGLAGSVLPRRSYGWLRRRLVLNTGNGERREIALSQRHFSKLLVPGGLVTEVTEVTKGRDARDAGVPLESDTAVSDTAVRDTAASDTAQSSIVESDTIEQFIEE